MSYKSTIGLEVHVELKTNTKLFSSSKNTYGAAANSCVNEIDLGYPGTLPTLNKKAVELAVKTAHVLNCEIAKEMHFDRKNYFYPDNSKNYQITQNKTPIGFNGYVEIMINGQIKKIGIERIHIEEDTAKSNHQETFTLLDFNRAGVPLVEIVTKPDINSSEEAMLYLERLRELLFYAEVSDVKMEEGSMRCDANISVSKTDILGNRAEIKNIGSIRSVGQAVEIETKRQIAALESGEIITEETRRIDEKNNTTILMRKKETGNDYRYFPEPDIPYLYLDDQKINSIIETLPPMPDKRRKMYQERHMSDLNIEKIIQNKDFSDYLLTINETTDLEKMVNILLGDVMAYLNKTNQRITDTKLSLEKLSEVVDNLTNKVINNNHIKTMLIDLLETDQEVPALIKKLNIITLSDDSLEQIIDEVLTLNQESVNDYKAGKTNAFKYLVGQVMKQTKGSGNPTEITKMIQEKISE